jgi:hypothetical protein
VTHLDRLVLALLRLRARLGFDYPNSVVLIGSPAARAAYAAGARRRNGGQR